MTVDDAAAEILGFRDSQENRCFVCGPGNPSGLHLHFEVEDGVVRARFSPRQWQQGWEQVVHGGVLAAVLDEAMAYVLFFGGYQGVTARLEVRYRKPARAGDELVVEARAVREGRRITDLESVLRRGDEVVAEASARFMRMGALTRESLVSKRG